MCNISPNNLNLFKFSVFDVLSFVTIYCTPELLIVNMIISLCSTSTTAKTAVFKQWQFLIFSICDDHFSWPYSTINLSASYPCTVSEYIIQKNAMRLIVGMRKTTFDQPNFPESYCIIRCLYDAPY